MEKAGGVSVHAGTIPSKLPRSLAVIGAGVIGVEYATIFSALDIAGDPDRTATAVNSIEHTASGEHPDQRDRSGYRGGIAVDPAPRFSAIALTIPTP